MGYEIDFLPVGSGERGGDAICMRFWEGQDLASQSVIVIDGGTVESGGNLVKHVKTYYQTEIVDLAILTHSDSDHASGMHEVLEGLQIQALGMNLPWERAENIKHLFKNGKITDTKLNKYIKKNLEAAYEVWEIANRKGITIFDAFSDRDWSQYPFKILGPSTNFYDRLLPDFDCTPEAKESLLETLYKTAKETVTNLVDESLHIETLKDPDDSNLDSGTKPENNSSVISYLEWDNIKFLFTGDSGVSALYYAYLKAVSYGIDLKTVNFIQIPHHGSKRNVGPWILNMMIGPKLNQEEYLKTAYISAPPDGEPKHPSKKVINAFKRRGFRIAVTRTAQMLYRSLDAPDRGWESLTYEPWYNKVEDD